jgi:hypothetical protein
MIVVTIGNCRYVECCMEVLEEMARNGVSVGWWVVEIVIEGVNFGKSCG